jgi:NitT/TauT family transport system ATP-binding protein
MAAIRIGFIPLVDCAPLVVLQELGFARDEGLRIELHREISWSNIRDKLAVGIYEASHLLAPMALAANYGISGPRVDIVAPYVLNLNGDVLCASTTLLQRCEGLGADDRGRLIAAVRRATPEDPVVFGVPFFFSTHHYLLRYWLASSGVDPDRSVRIAVVPPPLMLDALRNQVIDAFLVGEPWGSTAVDAGLASIVLPGTAIWSAAPEKVLGLQRGWAEANGEALQALLRALYRASVWASDPVNLTTLSELLSRRDYLDLPPELIERSLTGGLTMTPRGVQAREDRFLIFHEGAATFPWRSQAIWFYVQMKRWGHIQDSGSGHQVALKTFDPALYRKALEPLGVELPGANAKLEGALPQRVPAASNRGRLFLGPDLFCDGVTFDPDAYLT